MSRPTEQGSIWLVDHAPSRAIAAMVEDRPLRRRGKAVVLVVALLLILATAGFVWVEVARKLSKPEPVFVPKPPVVSGVVWSNRVFTDRAALRRWLAARHLSYVAWERAHPAAAALLRSRSR